MSSNTTTAAVFMSGNSQAIRLPKSFRIDAQRVTLRRVGRDIVISAKPSTMHEFLAALPHIPDAPLQCDDGPEEPVAVW